MEVERGKIMVDEMLDKNFIEAMKNSVEQGREICAKMAAEMNANTNYPQDQEANEYRYISPAWLDAIAEGLTKGAAKHPGETWRSIPAEEHLARAMRHINLYRMGDRSEPHIINASMRVMMAFEMQEAEKGEQSN